jgi:hypothetical protein
MPSSNRLLPNLIIAGAPKAGTSSLHLWLADHPDALGAIEKETYFFVDPGTHMHRPDRHIANGLDGYSDYFRPVEGRHYSTILESTPSYLYSQTALELLPSLPTEPRFIFVLREPSAQIYSLFTYFKNNWTWIPRDLTFEHYVDEVSTGTPDYMGNELANNALRYGAYVDYLSRWRDRVGAERMRVWLFDDLVADKAAFTKRAAAFAGLDQSFYDSYDFPSDNETYQVRSGALQSINVAVRGMLPKGRTYDALRGLYRGLNTRKPGKAGEDDMAIREALKGRFADANARLAREFDLDLSGWH